MAKRLFLTDNMNTPRGRAVKLAGLEITGVLAQKPNILHHFTSAKLNGSIYLIDETQAIGDLIASQPGVIEIPLSSLDKSANNLSNNPVVQQVIARIGYDFTARTVRNALYVLEGREVVTAGQVDFD